VPMSIRVVGELALPAIGLGCAGFSLDHDNDADRATRTIRAAVEAGMTLLDTALAYATADGRSNEALLRQVLGPTPVVISTKGGHFRSGDSFPVDGRPDALRQHCEQSLRNLGVERIDLYHLHWPDATVPIEESLGALADLQRAGKIHHIGVSNVDLDQARAAHRVTAIASVQNQLSLFHQAGREVVDWCTEHGPP
jgi:pyridoxine 4-dehydrogenase